MSYTYDAWGNFVETISAGAENSTALSNPFRYRGYYYDTDLELYYLNARYYDSATCRFINADGYINANGDLVGFNMYAYCSNNPVMYTDPTGEIAGWIVALIVAAVVTTVVAAVIVSNVVEINDSEEFVENNDDIEAMTDEEYEKYDEDHESHNGMTDEQRLAYIRRYRMDEDNYLVTQNWTEAEMLREMRYHEKVCEFFISIGIDPDKEGSLAYRTKHTSFEEEQTGKTYFRRNIGNIL